MFTFAIVDNEQIEFHTKEEKQKSMKQKSMVVDE